MDSVTDAITVLSSLYLNIWAHNVLDGAAKSNLLATEGIIITDSWSKEVTSHSEVSHSKANL
jgi:hypothetical protein